MSSTSILEDYKAELKTAEEWKAAGFGTVSAMTAGAKLANGRAVIPVDEYIAHWQAGITAMEAGADQELFNY